MEPSADLVAYSCEQGKRLLEKRELESLKKYGQFLTSLTVACSTTKQAEEFPIIQEIRIA